MTDVEKYMKLVEDARGRDAHDGNLYYRHHIFPRSLYPRFKHCSWNIVLLTYSEHHEAHILLSRITAGKCQEVMQRDLQYFS